MESQGGGAAVEHTPEEEEVKLGEEVGGDALKKLGPADEKKNDLMEEAARVHALHIGGDEDPEVEDEDDMEWDQMRFNKLCGL